MLDCVKEGSSVVVSDHQSNTAAKGARISGASKYTADERRGKYRFDCHTVFEGSLPVEFSYNTR